MAEKILGLDIGSFSIKAALFESSFTTSTLINLYESAPLHITENHSDQDILAIQINAIEKLIQDNAIDYKTVVSALPSSQISFKPMTFPLNSSQIEKILPFEMENFLPFSIDQMTFDHQVLSYEKPNSHILVTAVKNQVIENHLHVLSRANIDPAILSTDACEINQALYLDPQRELPEHYAILHIGHRNSYLIFIHQQRIQNIRSLFFGGHHLTQAIRKNLDLTLEQAIEVKHTHGVLELPDNPLRSDDLKKLSDTLQQAWQAPLNQIKQNIGLYNASHGKEEPMQHLFLTGGSSELKNLSPWLSPQVNMPCEKLDALPDSLDFKDQLHDKQGSFHLAIALGQRVAIKGPKRKTVSHIDFRKNDYAFAKDLSDINSIALFFGKWLTALFVIAILFQTVRYVKLKNTYTRTEKSTLKTFQAIDLKTKKKPKTSRSALKALKTETVKYEKKQGVLTAGLGEETSLGVLQTISNLINASISIDVKELSIDNNKITLRAMTDSFEGVDNVVSALKSHKTFSAIDLGERKEGNNGKVNFDLTITIETEESKKAQARKKAKAKKRTRRVKK